MSLSTFVKISTISNLSDARYCAGMGVDMLGFCFNPSNPEAISPELFLEIKNWVAGVRFVGEFGDLSAEEIIDIQKQMPLDFIEISDLDQVEKIGLLGKPLIYSMELTTDNDVSSLASTFSYLDELVDYVVLNCKNPDLFNAINQAASFYHGRLKLILAFNLNVDSLDSIKGYAGIQLTGTAEEKPGQKDYNEVMDMLEALEVD